MFTLDRIKSIFRPRCTWDQLLADYLSSGKFRKLRASTQTRYRCELTKWIAAEQLGAQPVAALTRRELEAMLDHRSQGAAYYLFKRVRMLIRFGKDQMTDITIGIRCEAIGAERAAWTEDEIEQYRQRWPMGTRERLALELALNTGQRRGDLAAMRWDHIKQDRIAVTQQKTKVRLSLPIHPDLQAALDKVKGARSGPILPRVARPAGAHMTPEGLGNLFSQWIEEAGLGEHCVLHGLRHAVGRRLTEAGATPHQIMAITGHKTLSEVQRYTKGADQSRLADAAMRRMG